MTRRYENIDVALPALASAIKENGDEVGSRLGERTVEVLHEQILFEKPWKREVLVQGRGANVVAQIAETMWVLAGRDDVEWLSRYLPRAKDFSDDGKVWRGGYGPRLRRWVDHSVNPEEEIDQLKHVVQLLANDRTTRRAVLSIYDPVRDTLPGKDIPCNDFLSFISRKGYLDLSVFVRSNDLIWGWSGINQFEWSALQEIVAGILGLRVGRLIFNTTSLHIYDRHWEKARRLEVAPLAHGYSDSPRFLGSAVHNYGSPEDHPINRLDDLLQEWFRIETDLRLGRGSMETSVMNFPEPMMCSWLRVIAWYWTGDEEYLTGLAGTRLWAAVHMSPKSVHEHAARMAQMRRENPQSVTLVEGVPSGSDGAYQAGDTVTLTPVDLYPVVPPLEFAVKYEPATKFIDYVDRLHREKGAAYGGSWKKRGEQMSILANIARKIDRLEGGVSTTDETQADTAIDLMVYLCKYRLWLSETNPELSLPMLAAGDEYDNLRALLEWLDKSVGQFPAAELTEHAGALPHLFSQLEAVVVEDPHREDDTKRRNALRGLLFNSYTVARARWEASVKPDYQNPYRNIDA